MNLRRNLANALRRAAHKLHPEHISSIDVAWERNLPPHVDIQFRTGKRVSGYVGPCVNNVSNVTHVHPSPDGWPQGAGPYTPTTA